MSTDDTAVLTRTKLVWLSLAASMTAVAGLLLLTGPRPPVASTPIAAALGDEPTHRGIEAIFETAEPLDHDRWAAVVIHDSSTPSGSADTLARRDEARGIRGLGMHFVIGNGQGLGDGEIQIGYRWDQQLPGAHVVGQRGEELNLTAVGICLVGDGERRAFTPAQINALAELVATLRERLGLPPDAVLLHRDVAAVASPGRLFPTGSFQARLDQFTPAR